MGEVTREAMFEALRHEIERLDENPYSHKPGNWEHEHFAAMSAALRELEAGGWQEIESAPRDASVLVTGEGERMNDFLGRTAGRLTYKALIA